MTLPVARLLIDTHVFIWWRADDETLSPAASQAIAEAAAVFVSAASAWEASIKAALGKLDIPEAFSAGVADSGFTPLPITMAHAEHAASLPAHHRDPFDRMLVAQCTLEEMTLVTRDPLLELYDVPIIRA